MVWKMLKSTVHLSQQFGGHPRKEYTRSLFHGRFVSLRLCSWIIASKCPNSCTTTAPVPAASGKSASSVVSSQPRFIVGCVLSDCSASVPIADHNRPVQVCGREDDCPDAWITCFLLHDNTKIIPLCNWGERCIDSECRGYRHPGGRCAEVCPLEGKCQDAMIACFKLHPLSKLVALCHYRENCVNYVCSKRHPPGRKELCQAGPSCWNHITQNSCPKLHPRIQHQPCRWSMNGGHCRAYGCTFVHPRGHPEDCPMGMGCQTQAEPEGSRCPNKHPRYQHVIRLEDGRLRFE